MKVMEIQNFQNEIKKPGGGGHIEQRATSQCSNSALVCVCVCVCVEWSLEIFWIPLGNPI